ncbi:hypothetical protein PCYB_005690 [Plasmodium cynomolgi strain B]|uniref:CYIR protein n=1 Tax=Plasmodium cynomolgi (strain B) TaxID=1120755 RepID=K6V382_PLACD|nr:hypothetical protein PCYB_005690 [Plasmodium cynomolgi strain B]GAB69820.1 hypothetical protein PCYB_005690 [Plasmodium cynomolgi strain B]
MGILSCADDTVEDGYSFYEHIDKYLEYEKICLHDQKSKEYNYKCESIGLDQYNKEDEKLSNICSRFHCLFDKLITSTIDQTNYNEKNAHFAYVKYWLIHELHKMYASIDDAKHFLKRMITADRVNETMRELNENWDNIDKDEMKNMYELFYLYESYIKNTSPMIIQTQKYFTHTLTMNLINTGNLM